MLDHCRTFCRPRQGRKERRCIQRRRAPSRKSPAKDDEDYAVFAQVLEAAVERTQMRLLAYCSLPNHGHLVIWPQEDGRLFPVHAPGGRSRTRNVGTLTAAVRAVATCTKDGSSPFRCRGTSISTRFVGTLSGTRCERILPLARNAGVGAVCTAGNMVRRRRCRCWRLGHCRVGRAGSSTSTDRKPRRSWRRCVVARNAAVHSPRELGATR